MSATPDSTLANPDQRIADLERQLGECKAERDEALQRETATAEVLQVINSSPGDVAPVFDAMLEKAMNLCEASFGCFGRFDGEAFHLEAHRGLPAPVVEALRVPLRPSEGGPLARIIGGEAVVRVGDLADSEAYRSGNRGRVTLIDLGGARTAVWVALRKNEGLVGVLVIYRTEVRPFTDKHVALLRNFRRAGSHCDGERAAVHGDARSAGAADRNRRGVAGD